MAGQRGDVLGNVREIFWPCTSPDMGCLSSDRFGILWTDVEGLLPLFLH
jgi:hypothetical protein